jgi:hypothetical protein
MSNITNRFEFYANLVNTNNLTTGVEVGVWKGEWSNYMLKNTKIEQLYQVDPWRVFSNSEYNDSINTLNSQKDLDTIYNDVRNLLAEYKNDNGTGRSIVLRGTSK